MKNFIGEIKKNYPLYVMVLPGVILFLLFNYLPMAGIQVAFRHFNFREGLFRSEWVGFENFRFFLTSPRVARVVWNTFVLNISFIVVHTVLQIAGALMLNELRTRWFKKLTQSLTFLPYFVSWIIVSVFVYNLLNFEYGAVNNLLVSVGLEPVAFYRRPEFWPLILILVDSWKWIGFGMIIYMATLSGISPEYYEAATIDGASRWQQTWRITIPMLIPTVSILSLLALGRVLNADFGMFYGIIGDNSVLFPTTDVVDTFVFRALRVLGDIGMASAVGFLQSIVGFLMVLGSNLVARRLNPEGALF
ncbi:MAG: ABC transporter permease [Spirochaetales bacterium]